ncbi:lipoyl(octanoyl) transferase LipB [Allostella humosa]|uniref:lipoyl(octanoyl) transferase LipB n=1 Tax=Stella humosa TaxID=94 RepID=UPI0015D10F85|nr:lipoyl(octanoyl) transferase LipB [Stella humosa]
MPPASVGTRPTALEWRVEDALVDYPAAVQAMDARAAAIRAGTAPELVWLLEHSPLYTAGTSADDAELLDAGGLPVHRSGRGGRLTYHGPGQRIGYALLDLKQRNPDVRWYVAQLEAWLIETLALFNVKGERREGRIGVWVVGQDGRERKIAALGVRVRQWVTLHGIAMNVDPDLSRFGGIIPCGVREFGVTSLVREGILVSMPEVDSALRASFMKVFGEEPSGL